MSKPIANAGSDERLSHLATLEAVERRVLWLAVRMIDYANRERPKDDELKVGGHQASSTSMVSLMTALYLGDLAAADRVAVKPHASPVLHAIEYLLGRLDGSYLGRLRDFGGLQSYPSRTKDPFPVDYSTGSVGLGSAAPLFGALADSYVESHFGTSVGGRFISFLGDAELDEGNIWEALSVPLTRKLGNVLWIVDFNRQSLDRVIPGNRAHELERQFETLGWQVIELKYGRRLRAEFARENGEILRRRIDELPNEQYQGLFGASEETIASTLVESLEPGERDALKRLLLAYDGTLTTLIRDLGGHDLGDILTAFKIARREHNRPTVIFAYTIKGYGLEIAGRPMNHSAFMTAEQINRLRLTTGLTCQSEWDPFNEDTPEWHVCREAAERLRRPEPRAAVAVTVPEDLQRRGSANISTQAAFGRIMLELSRIEGLAERIVTVSPDVAVSTNLGGWINKFGVWASVDEPVYDSMEDSPLRWRVRKAGRHIELGISEMNLALLLGQLGLSWDVQGEQLFPIGTLYDPFVMRGLEGIVYSVYSGSRFVIVGTPSGISLSREGGAHQSVITPAIGIECPGLVYAEPCFGKELEWLLLDGLQRLQEPDGEALYLRLSTKPIDQSPFAAVVDRRGEQALREDILAGGFRIREPGTDSDRVVIATCGAIVPEALAAADALAADEGVEATVLCLSSPDRLYRGWRARQLRPRASGSASIEPSQIERLLLRDEQGLPMVAVMDGASHALAWLGSALGCPCIPLGVDRFGQAGSQPAVYAEYGISSEAIVSAALASLEL